MTASVEAHRLGIRPAVMLELDVPPEALNTAVPSRLLTTLVDDLLSSEPDGPKGAAQPLEVQVSAERAIDTTRIRVRGVTPVSAAGKGSHDWWRRKSAAEAAVADAGPFVTVAFPDRATAVLIVADTLPAARTESVAA